MKKSFFRKCNNPLSSFALRIRAAFSVLAGKSWYYSKEVYADHRITFSQEGEDGLLRRIFEHKQHGFYVDVGAHHPQRFSNTYLFYLRGWRGINIDPQPGAKALFDIIRSRDINIESGVSDVESELVYYAFNEAALNTFDSDIAATRVKNRDYFLVSQDKIKVRRLEHIMAHHLPEGQLIDFLSVDVEGLDLQVLKSNDWIKYRPTFVLAESLGLSNVYDAINSDLNSFMRHVGYSLFGKCVNTLVFIDSQSPPRHEGLLYSSNELS